MAGNIEFNKIDWSKIPKEEHQGETGTSFWQTVQYEGLRVRIVEYSEGYTADHWCRKGHVVHCVEGEFTSEFEGGGSVEMKKGMTYVVSDEMSSHRSVTKNGAKLLIIDGEILSK